MNNREFKFRVFNKKTNQWVHGPNNEVNLFGEMILLGGFMLGVSIEDLNDCVVLQYIGLIDQDGKEIYEGDILRVNNNYISVIRFGKYRNDEGVLCYGYFVQFNEFYGCDIIQYINFFQSYEKLEIVGNIFDNPELLK